MWKLTIKLMIFATPFAIIIGIPVALLWHGGECTSIDRVVQKQTIQCVYGTAYSDRQPYLKLAAYLKRKPDILVLGTSRVMQFRSQMFTSSFYNCGGAVEEILDYRRFLSLIPDEATPKLLIVGFNHVFLNPNFDCEYTMDSQMADIDAVDMITKTWRRLYWDIINGKIEAGKLLKKQTNIGIKAITNGSGFRYDGSYYYKKFIDDGGQGSPKAPDYGFNNSRMRIKNGINPFEHASEVSQKSLDELDKLLVYCKQRDIVVVGFLPPFADAVWSYMMEQGDHEYLRKLPDRMQTVFLRHGFDFFNFPNLSSCDSNDHEVTDGFHGSEKAYLRILIKMLDQSELLRPFTASRAFLQRELYSAKGDTIVFQ
ncbi:hypothetical protein ACFL3G_02145 [Planctomycetota bacterium]